MNNFPTFRMFPTSLEEDKDWLSLSLKRRALFQFILTKVVYNESYMFKGYTLTYGQVIKSFRDLADEFNSTVTEPEDKIDHSFITRAFKKFKEFGLLKHEEIVVSIHRKTLITITNSDVYDLIKMRCDTRNEGSDTGAIHKVNILQIQDAIHKLNLLKDPDTISQDEISLIIKQGCDTGCDTQTILFNIVERYNIQKQKKQILKEQQQQAKPDCVPVSVVVFSDENSFEEMERPSDSSEKILNFSTTSNDNDSNETSDNIDNVSKNQEVKKYYPCLDRIKDPSITTSHKISISQKYPKDEDLIKDAVDAITKPSFIPDETMLKSLHSAIKHKWKGNQPQIFDIEKNKKLARSLEKINHPYKFEALKDSLLIGMGTNGVTKEIKYSQTYEKFRTEVENQGKVILNQVFKGVI